MRAFALVAAFVMGTSAALGADPPLADSAPSPAETDTTEAGAEHEYLNSVSLFLGATREDAEQLETGFTFGLEYARRIGHGWSLGGVAERAAGDVRATLLLAQVMFNPIGGLVFTTGPGIEIRDGREEEEHSDDHEGSSESEGTSAEVVYRVGLLYEFKIDRFILAPTIDVDFVAREAALVVGANLGYEF